MTKNAKSLRTPQGQVSGLGSAKHGVEHWWHQRVTAIALVVLSLYLVTTFFTNVIFGDYQSAVDWISWPIATTAIILFLMAGFYHAVLGLQAVIEDYVHCEGLKIFSTLAVKFIAAALVVLGILATIVILIGSMMPHVPSAQ